MIAAVAILVKLSQLYMAVLIDAPLFCGDVEKFSLPVAVLGLVGDQRRRLALRRDRECLAGRMGWRVHVAGDHKVGLNQCAADGDLALERNSRLKPVEYLWRAT